MSTELIVGVLGAGSVGAVLASIVTGAFSKKKLGAEATEIITKAASGVVESLNAEVQRVNAAMAAVRAESAAVKLEHAAEMGRQRIEHDASMARQQVRHDAQMEAIRRVLQLHVAWDIMARAKLAEYGIELPEAPPLQPPLRSAEEIKDWLDTEVRPEE